MEGPKVNDATGAGGSAGTTGEIGKGPRGAWWRADSTLTNGRLEIGTVNSHPSLTTTTEDPCKRTNRAWKEWPSRVVHRKMDGPSSARRKLLAASMTAIARMTKRLRARWAADLVFCPSRRRRRGVIGQPSLRPSSPTDRIEIRRVIRAAHERPGGDMFEALFLGDFLVELERIRMHVFQDRQMLGRGPQILPHG